MTAVLQDQPLPARLVPWAAAEPASLRRCVLLALLLHLWAVLLLGNAPGGTALPGQGVFGAINVTLRGPESPSAPADTPPASPAPGLSPQSEAARWGGRVRQTELPPQSLPGAEQLGVPAPQAPQALPVQPVPRTAPLPLSAPEPLPEPAPVPAPPAPPAPPEAPPAPVERSLSAAPLPAAREAAPALAGTPLAAPELPALAPLPSAAATPAPLRQMQAAPVAPLPTVATPAQAALPAAPAPTTLAPLPAPAPLPGTLVRSAGTAGPDAGSRIGHDVPTPAAQAASQPPRLNLELARPRGGELSRFSTPGALPVLPRPPERDEKLARDIEKAGKADCRKAYAEAGVLAVVPLAVDAVKGSGCKW